MRYTEIFKNYSSKFPFHWFSHWNVLNFRLNGSLFYKNFVIFGWMESAHSERLQLVQNNSARKLERKPIVVQNTHNLTNRIFAHTSDVHVQICKNYIPVEDRVARQRTLCRIMEFFWYWPWFSPGNHRLVRSVLYYTFFCLIFFAKAVVTNGCIARHRIAWIACREKWYFMFAPSFFARNHVQLPLLN